VQGKRIFREEGEICERFCISRAWHLMSHRNGTIENFLSSSWWSAKPCPSQPSEKIMERCCNDEDIISFLTRQKKKTKKLATSTHSSWIFHRYLPFSVTMQTHSNSLLDIRQWTKDRNTLSVPPLRGLVFLQYIFK
jgi:hypothetical protein